MDDSHQEIRQAATQARMIMMRLAGDGGLLSQIESGEWDHRLGSTSDMVPLLDAMRERARLDRIILDRFATEE